MKKPFILGLIGLALIAGLAVLFAKPPAKSQITNNGAAGQASSSRQQLFKDSPYVSYAYLVSTDNIDSSTKQALSGFKLEKQSIAGGGQTITLKALDAGYADQSYTLKPGDKLYFIETSLGDDPYNHELSLSDDTAIVVNAQGYISNV